MGEHKNRWKCKRCKKQCTALSWDKEPPAGCLYWTEHMQDNICPKWVQVGTNAKKAKSESCIKLL